MKCLIDNSNDQSRQQTNTYFNSYSCNYCGIFVPKHHVVSSYLNFKRSGIVKIITVVNDYLLEFSGLLTSYRVSLVRYQNARRRLIKLCQCYSLLIISLLASVDI